MAIDTTARSYTVRLIVSSQGAGAPVERTRDEVIRILHEQGPRSAAELAGVIGVSEGSVRRHMDIMVAEGLIEAHLERQPRGRPATKYRLSEAGEEQTAAVSYARLLDRLYPALAGLAREQVSGRSGPELLNLIFGQVAEGVAREHAPRVRATDFDERVGHVANALRPEGILNDFVVEGDTIRLRNVGCPYRSTAEETHAACDADRRTIELLLGTPVQQLSTVVNGAPTCEYLVHRTGIPVVAAER